MALLELKDLHVALEDGTEIVKGVDLAVNTNEVHAVMGPNGSGKSTLAYALMGHPAYEITEGEALFDGQSILELGADERAPHLGQPLGAEDHEEDDQDDDRPLPADVSGHEPRVALRPGPQRRSRALTGARWRSATMGSRT